MFKGIGNIASLMKTAQQMSGRVQEVNEQLQVARVTGSAGGGMVEIEANGLGEVLRVKIDPALLEAGDVEMLEDLLPAAINQAQAKAKQMHREAMQSMTEGINLPGLNEALDQLSGGNQP
jgi:DNA-binding YbaB/EbfC family protein